MSGHSKWSTIKRAKGVKDAARGKLFSKLSRAITIAVKEGGGGDPTANYKLRIAVDTARAANMPKENIDRAINKASDTSANLANVLYEGFGPAGVGILVDATTDNKNRTAQEIKTMIDRNGGTFAGPNAVAFNFATKGYLFINKAEDADSQLLALIDLGIEDYAEAEDGIEVYVDPSKTAETRDALEAAGFAPQETKLIRKPMTTVELNESEMDKLMNLIDLLEEHDDVDAVYVNVA